MTDSPLPPAAATGASLMIIDDDPQVAPALMALFEYHGFVVGAFSDGRKALKHLKEHAVELVILDIFIPDFDGFELMAECQQLNPRPRIVAMTGGMPAMLTVAQILGADGIISKPFLPSQLLQVVNRWGGAINSHEAFRAFQMKL